LSNVVFVQKRKGVPGVRNSLLLLVFNYLNKCKHKLAVPFFVSKKEIIKEEAKVKYAIAHVYCRTITVQT